MQVTFFGTGLMGTGFVNRLAHAVGIGTADAGLTPLHPSPPQRRVRP
jgi:hypothetical protein